MIEPNFEEAVGKSTALRRVLAQVEIVAATDSTVLICGETGNGNELIARAIHNHSPRHGNAFVKLNCAAIPNWNANSLGTREASSLAPSRNARVALNSTRLTQALNQVKCVLDDETLEKVKGIQFAPRVGAQMTNLGRDWRVEFLKTDGYFCTESTPSFVVQQIRGNDSCAGKLGDREL